MSGTSQHTDKDWEECRHVVSVDCPSTRGENTSACFWLESVSWKVSVDLGQQWEAASLKLRATQNYLSMLEVDEGDEPTGDSEGWIGRLSNEVCLQERAITDIAKRVNGHRGPGGQCAQWGKETGALSTGMQSEV